MKLSVREAAALLGRSPRAVRARVARGDLPGEKRDGRWWIDRRALQLPEKQRRELQEKADRVRRSVDELLPSRMATTSGQRSRSMMDLDGFRHGGELLAEIRSDTLEALAATDRERVGELLEEALLALAEAAQHFDRGLKLAALGRCRAHLARTVGLLFLAAGMPPAEPVFSWVSRLESEVIPAVVGFTRWAEGLRGGKP